MVFREDAEHFDRLIEREYHGSDVKKPHRLSRLSRSVRPAGLLSYLVPGPRQGPGGYKTLYVFG